MEEFKFNNNINNSMNQKEKEEKKEKELSKFEKEKFILLNQNQKEKEEKKEKKEKELSKEEKIKAAEVLCYINLKYKDYSEEDINTILTELENTHSKEVIYQAFKVANLRERKFEFKKSINLQKKIEHKSFVDYNKEEIINERLNESEIDKEYRENIINLKKLLLEEEFQKLQLKYPDNKEKVMQELKLYDIKILLPLINTELQRDLENKKELLFLEKSTEKLGFFKKIFYKFLNLPKTTRAVLGAGIIGAGVAFFMPGMALTVLPLYIGYRALRGLIGGTLGSFLQKVFGNYLVEKAFKEEFKTFQKEVSDIFLERNSSQTKTKQTKTKTKFFKFLKNEEIEELKKYKNQMEKAINEKNFQKLAEINYEIAQNNLEKTNKILKFRSHNYKAMSLACGFLGGYLGAVVFDLFFPSSSLSSADAKRFDTGDSDSGFSKEQIEDATIRKGEGVEHVFKRQLLSNPEKFGYEPKYGNVESWANKTAHLIAIKNGYFNVVTGEEVRVFDYTYKGGTNPKYLLFLEEDNSIKVKEFFENSEVQNGSNNLNSYEYKYKLNTNDEYYKPPKLPNDDIKIVDSPNNKFFSENFQTNFSSPSSPEELFKKMSNNLDYNKYNMILNMKISEIINLINSEKSAIFNSNDIENLKNFFKENNINLEKSELDITLYEFLRNNIA